MSIPPLLPEASPRNCQIFGSLSVVIVGSDSECSIAQKMCSVLRNLRPGDQLVTVDNGSTDSSLMAMLEVAEEDSRVLVVHIPRTIDSRARARGLRECSGDYVLWLGLNDELLDGGVDQIREAIHSNRFALAFVMAGSVPACLPVEAAEKGGSVPSTELRLAERYLAEELRFPLCTIIWRRTDLGLDPYRFDHGAAEALVLLSTTLAHPGCMVSAIAPVRPGVKIEPDFVPRRSACKAHVEEAFLQLPSRLKGLRKRAIAKAYARAGAASKRQGDRVSAMLFLLAAFTVDPAAVLAHACGRTTSKSL